MSIIWRVGKARLPHDEYVASLPRKRMAVAALIRDADDRALLVSPTYEDSWLVPGGVVDAGESPHAACRREIMEEIGLSLPPGRILAVDWTPQDPDWPEGVFIVYDGGTLSEADIAGIIVQDDELDGFRFAASDAIASLVNTPLARRIESAFVALRSGSVLSLEHGKPIELASACPRKKRMARSVGWQQPGDILHRLDLPGRSVRLAAVVQQPQRCLSAQGDSAVERLMTPTTGTQAPSRVR